MTQLTVQNVHETTMMCLFGATEKTHAAVIVQGVNLNIGFDPVRLEKHKSQITEMLSQLPDAFMQNIGGGWSFLNACNNNKGEQWTGDHATVDELLCLGLAIEKVAYNAPRNFWSAFPGNMPYFYVKS